MTTDLARNSLLDLITQLRSQKLTVQKQFQTQIEQIEKDLEAVERTLNLLYGTGTANDTSQLKFIDSNEVNAISDARSHMEALKIIATINNSKVNVTRSADILIRAGRTKSKRRNLIASLYGMLKNSDEWEWLSPGTFILKPALAIKTNE